MKTNAVSGLFSGLSAAFAGCGNHKASSSEGKTIKPITNNSHAGNLADGKYCVSFSKKNIIRENGRLVMKKVKVFAEEVFDIEDVKSLQTGDTIVSGYEDIEIESMKKTSNGEILINGGYKQDGLTLVFEEDSKGYIAISSDEVRSYSDVGTMKLEISPKVIYTDSSDPDSKVKAGNADLLEKMDDTMIDYNLLNTTIKTKGAVVVAIDRVDTE